MSTNKIAIMNRLLEEWSKVSNMSLANLLDNSVRFSESSKELYQYSNEELVEAVKEYATYYSQNCQDKPKTYNLKLQE